LLLLIVLFARAGIMGGLVRIDALFRGRKLAVAGADSEPGVPKP